MRKMEQTCRYFVNEGNNYFFFLFCVNLNAETLNLCA